MARVIKNDLWSGKLGNKIYYVRNGKQFIRDLPTKRRKSSPGQFVQRMKFSMANEILRTIRELVSKTFTGSKNRTPYNIAFAYITANVITGSYPDYSIDWSKLFISQGKLLSLEGCRAFSSAGKIIFQWDPYVPVRGKYSDQVVLAVYAPVLKQWIYTIGPADRKASMYELDVKSFTGHTVHTYIGFISADWKLVSNSQYTGVFEL